jgi:hypothetical protein
MERVSIKPLKDEYGIIKSAKEILPKELWNDFIESIAELEDNNNHITATYPKTRLHKVAGSKKSIYRADIKQTSGWRMHIQFSADKFIKLCDLIPQRDHNRTLAVIQQKIDRYE